MPQFEEMLIRSGILLVKYWFSVSDEEQERRFQERVRNPRKNWKLSPMDLESRAHWVDYSRAKDACSPRPTPSVSPWWVVEADDKRRARLNCISHLLDQVPYEELAPQSPREIPDRQVDDYVRPPMESLRAVPERY